MSANDLFIGGIVVCVLALASLLFWMDSDHDARQRACQAKGGVLVEVSWTGDDVCIDAEVLD